MQRDVLQLESHKFRNRKGIAARLEILILCCILLGWTFDDSGPSNKSCFGFFYREGFKGANGCYLVNFCLGPLKSPLLPLSIPQHSHPRPELRDRWAFLRVGRSVLILGIYGVTHEVAHKRLLFSFLALTIEDGAIVTKVMALPNARKVVSTFSSSFRSASDQHSCQCTCYSQLPLGDNNPLSNNHSLIDLLINHSFHISDISYLWKSDKKGQKWVWQ